jgi:hypothetical protein
VCANECVRESLSCVRIHSSSSGEHSCTRAASASAEERALTAHPMRAGEHLGALRRYDAGQNTGLGRVHACTRAKSRLFEGAVFAVGHEEALLVPRELQRRRDRESRPRIARATRPSTGARGKQDLQREQSVVRAGGDALHASRGLESLQRCAQEPHVSDRRRAGRGRCAGTLRGSAVARATGDVIGDPSPTRALRQRLHEGL